MADQLLDRKTSPAWQGFTGRLMTAMPTATKLWDEHAEILAEDLRQERGRARATEFYRQHRDEMDAGAVAAWPERHEPGELSAIQHAMTIRAIRGEACFLAEYQNAPVDPTESREVAQITPGAVLRKANGLERYAVPVQATLITVGIDVQRACLPWLAVGWAPGFGGDVLAYGAEPEQGRPYWTLREVERDLLTVHPGASWQAALTAGLESLVERLAGREWLGEDGRPYRVDQIVIDAGYGESTDAVHEFCRRSRHSAILRPYFGKAIRPGEQPLDEWIRKPGDQVGPGWRIPRQTRRATRAVLADASAWKSFVADRLLAPAGDAASLGLYGREPEHRMLADQLSAETRTRVTANGRTSDRWDIKPNRDNHWLDCLSMAAIAASIRGLRLDPLATIRRVRSADEPGPAHQAEPASMPGQAQPKPTPRPILPRPAARGGWLKGYGGRP
jgi:phage terminase large subunit GpA-like protein